MGKVLLTTVCTPFGGPGEGDSVGAELFHAQVTRSQGIFSIRQVIRCWGLDYIAENIEAPSVVLHYPREREFVRELVSGGYDYVCVNFVVATFHKARRMAYLVRKHSPASKVVFGGYGTVLDDELLTPHCDHICREEGIGYMRRILGEKEGRPLRHPYTPIPSPSIYTYPLGTKVAHVTGGLGCPNGCDFCSTSHYFGRKYIPLIESGRELFAVMKDMERKAELAKDRLSGFILIDEDFFQHRKRAEEFLDCIRKEGASFSIMGFGSVRGISQFTADEVAEMGFVTIWIAFEGKEAGYEKLEGKPMEELFSELKSRGVAILSSMIIGFPYQDADTVLREFDQLMGLEPSLFQALIYFAFPGTPLYRTVVDEGRFLPGYLHDPDYRRWDGFSTHFRHDHFRASELEALQRYLYREDFERLGPSIVRILRVYFEGYKNLRESGNPLLEKKAAEKRAYVHKSLPGLVPAILFGPNRVKRAEARDLFGEIIREFGPLTVGDLFRCFGAVLLAAWTYLTLRFQLFQQPRLLRVEHRLQSPARAQAPRHGYDSFSPSFLLRILQKRVHIFRFKKHL